MIKPKVIDITLCNNKWCKNKCKRYYENWDIVNILQSYINPHTEFDANGNVLSCKFRMEERNE